LIAVGRVRGSVEYCLRSGKGCRCLEEGEEEKIKPEYVSDPNFGEGRERGGGGLRREVNRKEGYGLLPSSVDLLVEEQHKEYPRKLEHSLNSEGNLEQDQMLC
jgi:hypothetical protein